MIKFIRLILITGIIFTISQNFVYSSNTKGLDGIYEIPSALTCSGYSYFKNENESYLKYTQSFAMSVFEVSYLKSQEDGYDDMVNGKMKLMKESYYLPGMAVGVYNYNHNVLNTSYFFAMTKSFPSLGTLVHAGIVREKVKVGNYDYNPFVGFEQTIYSIFSVMAEYTTDKKINAGFRIGGNGMMSADVFFSDVGNEFDFEKRHYNISLESRF